jgi:hypothetical protein
MTVSLKHAFNCAKSDGTDVTAVKPSNWNAEHTLTAASGKMLGTPVGSTTVSELPISVDSTLQSMTPPSGNTASRPASPTSGMIRLNTTTGLLEAYLNAAWGAVDAFPAGTRMLFQQTAAPAGWTKDTTLNDKALRVVSGTVGSGGTLAFSAAMASRSTDSVAAGGTVASTTLDVTQIPSHQHFLSNGADGTAALTASNYVNESAQAGSSNGYILKGSATVSNIGLSSPTGGGGGHTHGFTGTGHSHTVDMSVQYVDLIIAVKN